MKESTKQAIKKIGIVVGVVGMATALVMGATAEEVSAATQLAIGGAGFVIALIAVFTKGQV